MYGKHFHKMTLNDSGRPFFVPRPAYLELSIAAAEDGSYETGHVDVTCPHGETACIGTVDSVPESHPLYPIVHDMIRRAR